MADRYDIQLDKNGEIIFVDQDFMFDISNNQHIEDTINSYPGWWKENFSDGVGIVDFVNSEGQETICARLIKINLQSDLYDVGTPAIIINPDGTLSISPNATF